MKYKVYYYDIQIAVYNIKEDKSVEYTTIKEGFDELKKRGLDVLPMLKKGFSAKKFPFLDNRIKDCKRFGENVRIRYSTDPYELVEED